MENNKSLRELLHEHLELKGLSLARLQQLSEIPERFLDSLIRGDYHKMPAAPYVRGYLMKIADVLNLSGEELWRQYKKEVSVKSSGASDRLPENRFVIRSLKKRWLVIAVLVIAILVYLAVNLGNLLGQPEITVSVPASKLSVSNFPSVTLSGKINPVDTFRINNEEISVSSDGRFKKTYNLQTGINTFEFSVKRFLGKEIKIVRQVLYQAQP